VDHQKGKDRRGGGGGVIERLEVCSTTGDPYLANRTLPTIDCETPAPASFRRMPQEKTHCTEKRIRSRKMGGTRKKRGRESIREGALSTSHGAEKKTSSLRAPLKRNGRTQEYRDKTLRRLGDAHHRDQPTSHNTEEKERGKSGGLGLIKACCGRQQRAGFSRQLEKSSRRLQEAKRKNRWVPITYFFLPGAVETAT